MSAKLELVRSLYAAWDAVTTARFLGRPGDRVRDSRWTLTGHLDGGSRDGRGLSRDYECIGRLHRKCRGVPGTR